MKDQNSSVNQRIKGDFVKREVLSCFSYEMGAIMQASSYSEQVGSNKDLPDYEDIDNLYAYRCQDCGELTNTVEELEQCDDETRSNGDIVYVCPSCRHETNELEHFEQEPQEIFEWWIVTEYLYRKLKEKGEPVLEWGNNYYWGRTTCGQSILLDGVISSICSDMEILEGQTNDWSK